MHTKNNELSVGKKHEKSAKTSSTITRVMQRQKDERIEWNVGRVWTSTYTRKFFLSTDKLLRTIPGSSEGKTIRIGSGRVCRGFFLGTPDPTISTGVCGRVGAEVLRFLVTFGSGCLNNWTNHGYQPYELA